MRRLLHVSTLVGLMLLLAFTFVAIQACDEEDDPEANQMNTCPTNGDDDDDDVTDDDDDDTSDDDDTGDDDTTTPPGEEVTVDSTSDTWVDSAIAIGIGDVIDFVATGTIALDSFYEEVSPDGVAEIECGVDCPLATAPRGALLGRIGAEKGEPFVVGSELADYTSTEAGNLFLIVNDSIYDNNEGSFTVYVDVEAAGDDDTTDDDITDDDTTDDDTTDDDTADDDTV